MADPFYIRSVDHNRLFLTLFISRIFTDPKNKVQIYGLQLLVLLDHNCAVTDFLDNTVKLVIAIECVNKTFFTNKSFCKFNHFPITLRLSVFNDFSGDDRFLIAIQNVDNYKQKNDRYVL